MSVAAWLARREIAGRTGGFLLGSVVVAAVTAIAIATDSLARGGEDDVAAQMDRISAPIEVVPAGVSATQLARAEMGTAFLPPGTMNTIVGILGSSVRELDARLVTAGSLAGQEVVVVGISGAVPPVPHLRPGEIAIGAILAGRRGLQRSDTTRLMGEKVQVAALLPSMGSVDDVSVFSSLQWLQELGNAPGKINHVRVFLRAGTDSVAAKASLVSGGLAANVIRRDRGDAVDREAPRSLELWRAAAVAAAATACAAWVAFAALLNLAERRQELATLAAIGGGSRQLVLAVVLRSAATAAVGALLGIGVGTAVGSAVHSQSSGTGMVAFAIAFLTVVLSAGIVALIAARAARADPIPALEER